MPTTQSPAADAAQPEKRRVGRASPLRKPLPTDRITVPKQFEIIRAYASVSGPERRPVTNKQVSEIIGITGETVSLGNAFFVDVGVLEKTDVGLVASAEALAFKTAGDLSDENPESRLAPLMRKAWFFQVLRPKLEFTSMAETAAVTELAVSVHAEKADTLRLRALIDYLVTTGVVTRENGSLSLVRTGHRPPLDPKPNTTRTPAGEREANDRQDSFGAITFNVSVNVGMEELLGWDAARITAFMDGVKGILRAQKGSSDAE